MRKQDKRSAEIYSISKALFAPTRLEITLNNFVNTLSLVLRMRRGGLEIPASEGEKKITAATRNSGSPSAADYTVPKAAIDQIMTAGRLVVPDVCNSELFKDQIKWHGIGPTAFIAAAVEVDHETGGMLWFERAKESGYDYEEDVHFLSVAADLAGRAIRLHRTISGRGRTFAEEQEEQQNSRDEQSQSSARQRLLKNDGIIGESTALMAAVDTAKVMAETNSIVLLRGETGTGKECFAKLIHQHSTRQKKPFIKFNCPALSESLLESELFGHEKGAFTGAIAQRVGRFESANGGTLLLDEIGEIPPAFQAKLLRVIQEGEFERVGGTKTLKVDVRLIFATNKDLEMAVQNGEFREDLYYRISGVPLILPPLRHRDGDIPLLARAFLQRFNEENGRDLHFAPPALDHLSKCKFPGNVRELENCVRRTATLARSKTITSSDFACQTDQCFSSRLWKGVHCSHGHIEIDAPAGTTPLLGAPANDVPPKEPGSAGVASNLIERDRLISALEEAGWNQAKAARILKKTPRQVGYALRRHGVDVRKL
ncbi:nif-specific transcriptional activator NifA [Sinorhizobium meliloti]|nr:nif-specific transcriptional activator NifA [Sinorhizobium meliloti]